MEDFISRRSLAGAALWQGRAPRLRSLSIELTERCDNACQHCYINLPREDAAAQQAELSTEEWKRILSEAAGLGCLGLRITGGEPLLREDFADLYLHARRLGLKVSLFTNARNLTPEIVDLLRRVPPLAKIQITVYGMSAETYEAVSCAPGSYEQFRQGLERLLEAGVPFLVKSVELPHNRHEMEAFHAWAATLPGAEPLTGITYQLDQRAHRDSPARMALIERLRMPPEELAAKLLAEPVAGRDMLELASRWGGSSAALLPCGAGGCAEPQVDAYGWLHACTLLRAPELAYNLRAGTLADALQRHFPRFGAMKNENPLHQARCGRCFLRDLCESCAAKAWMETGQLDGIVEYHCQVTHAIARRLGLLAEEEYSWEVTDGVERAAQLLQEGR